MEKIINRFQYRRMDFTPLLLVAAAFSLWGVMHHLLSADFFGPSTYNTYTLQAMA